METIEESAQGICAPPMSAKIDHEVATEVVPLLVRHTSKDEPERFRTYPPQGRNPFVDHDVQRSTRSDERDELRKRRTRIRRVMQDAPAHDEVERLGCERQPKDVRLRKAGGGAVGERAAGRLDSAGSEVDGRNTRSEVGEGVWSSGQTRRARVECKLALEEVLAQAAFSDELLYEVWAEPGECRSLVTPMLEVESALNLLDAVIESTYEPRNPTSHGVAPPAG